MSEPKEKLFRNTIFTNRLYLNSEAADIHFTFTVDDIETLVPAHKNLLSTCSPVFHAMFFSDLKEMGNIEMIDASINGFKDFLAIFYMDEIKITDQNVAELAYLYDKYDVPSGLQMCEEFLLENTKSNDLCTHFQLATTFNLLKLQEYCAKKIGIHAVDVFKSDAFMKSSSKMLESILQLNNHICTANDIFVACIAWAKMACEQDETDETELRRVLGNIFYLIPFTGMKLDEFLNVTSSNPNLFTFDESSDIVNFITTGTSTDNIDKFIKKNVRYTDVFKWDDKSLLKCIRFGIKYTFEIHSTELTTFSSTHELIFGGFEFGKITNKTTPTKTVKMIISIFEENEMLVTSQIHENNLNVDVKLDHPIITKPNMKYTIQVEFRENDSDDDIIKGWKCLGFWGQSSYPLDSNIYIEFHRNIEMGLKNENSNIISNLYFNHL